MVFSLRMKGYITALLDQLLGDAAFFSWLQYYTLWNQNNKEQSSHATLPLYVLQSKKRFLKKPLTSLQSCVDERYYINVNFIHLFIHSFIQLHLLIKIITLGWVTEEKLFDSFLDVILYKELCGPYSPGFCKSKTFNKRRNTSLPFPIIHLHSVTVVCYGTLNKIRHSLNIIGDGVFFFWSSQQPGFLLSTGQFFRHLYNQRHSYLHSPAHMDNYAHLHSHADWACPLVAIACLLWTHSKLKHLKME